MWCFEEAVDLIEGEMISVSLIYLRRDHNCRVISTLKRKFEENAQNAHAGEGKNICKRYSERIYIKLGHFQEILNIKTSSLKI